MNNGTSATIGYPLVDLQKFVVGISKPAWWRLITRWKWRKLAHLSPTWQFGSPVDSYFW